MDSITIEITRDPATGRWTVNSPSLPGLVTEGASLPAALLRAARALIELTEEGL